MPHLPPSEIFEAYAKIALDKGLIKQAAETKDSKELKEYRNANHPRVGSDDISKIEALYGLKIDRPKSMEYEHNIAENAHPNQVIIAPSYDKLNGLVENINERQHILINITQKPVNGHLVQKKYAEELATELLKVATDLDNREMTDLRVLADTCLVQVNQLQKTALLPAVLTAPALLGLSPLAIAGLAAGVLGAAYLFNHMHDPDRGLVANIKNALDKLDALIGEDWFHQTFYATLKPEFLTNLKKFRADLATLKKGADDFNTIEAKMHNMKTLQELAATAQESGQDIVAKVEEFRHLLINLAPEINQAIELFSTANVKDMAIKDESWLSNLTSKIEPILHGGWGLFTDRFDDIREALKPLKASMESTVAEINRLDDQQAVRKEQIVTGLQESQQYAPQKSVETPQLGGQTTTTPGNTDHSGDIWAKYEAKMKDLLGS